MDDRMKVVSKRNAPLYFYNKNLYLRYFREVLGWSETEIAEMINYIETYCKNNPYNDSEEAQEHIKRVQSYYPFCR